ncbi:hypothetical protein ACSBR2_014157 [Camellia fascicularis]
MLWVFMLKIYAISITIRIVLGFMLLALIWRFDFPPFMVMIIAILNDDLYFSSVDVKTVLSRLMERLSNYAASSPEVLPEFLLVEAFAKLNNAIGKNMFQREKFVEHNANAVAAGRVLGVDLIEQITKRYI